MSSSVDRGSIDSNPSDAHSGALLVDGVPFHYAGLEPVNISASSVTINGSDTGGSTEFGDKDTIKISVKQEEGAEKHLYFEATSSGKKEEGRELAKSGSDAT